MLYNLNGSIANTPSNFQLRDEFANRPRYFEQNNPKQFNFKDFEPSMMPSKANKRGKVPLKFLLSYSDKILDILLPEAEKLLPLHLKHKAKYALIRATYYNSIKNTKSMPLTKSYQTINCY